MTDTKEIVVNNIADDNKKLIKKVIKYLERKETFTKFAGIVNDSKKFDINYFEYKLEFGNILVIVENEEGNIEAVGLLDEKIRHLGLEESDCFYLKHFAADSLHAANAFMEKAFKLCKEYNKTKIKAETMKPGVMYSYYKRMNGVEIDTDGIFDNTTFKNINKNVEPAMIEFKT